VWGKKSTPISKSDWGRSECKGVYQFGNTHQGGIDYLSLNSLMGPRRDPPTIKGVGQGKRKLRIHFLRRDGGGGFDHLGEL